MAVKFRTQEENIELIQGGILIVGALILDNKHDAAAEALYYIDNIVMHLRGKSASSVDETEAMKAFSKAVMERSIPTLSREKYLE